MGLAGYEFLDGYANKFFILSGADGSFVSPRAIPEALTDYYADLGIATAPRGRILDLPPDENGSTLVQRVKQSPSARYVLGQASGNIIVPYMVTNDVQSLADNMQFGTLVSPTASETLADKEVFQGLLDNISPGIAQETGLDVGIPSVGFRSQDRADARRAYTTLSRGGQRPVVVVKPKSASALGIFMLDAGQGFAGLEQILGDNFAEGERVLLEEYVGHNHSPSMQGSRIPGGSYGHLYLGRQFISMRDGRIEYDASQIPFDTPDGPVNKEAAARMQAVHGALGELMVIPNDIAGIGGFDSVIQTDGRGNLLDLKLTELNLHLPSSIAVYAAIHKLFPEGFSGVAFNYNVPLRSGETLEQFMNRNANILVRGRGQYGMLPLNGSLPDKVDVVLFARDEAQLAQLQAAVT